MVVIPLVLPLVMLGLIVALGRYEEMLLGTARETKHRGPRKRHLRAVAAPSALAAEANAAVEAGGGAGAAIGARFARDSRTRHHGRPRHAA